MMQGSLFEAENGQITDGVHRFRLWRGSLKPALTLPVFKADELVWPMGLLRELLAATPHPRVLWVMYNPSKADASTDDATMHAVLAFSSAYGFRRADVVNLWSYRATDSAVIADLLTRGLVDRATGGEEAERHIRAAAGAAHAVVFAWGALGAAGKVVEAHELARATQVEAMVRDEFRGHMPIGCMGYTRSTGDPYHPLYRPRSDPILRWRGRGSYPGANHQPPKGRGHGA